MVLPPDSYDRRWSGNDYSLLRYVPRNRGGSPATDLILNFKDANATAVATVSQMIADEIAANLILWKNLLCIKYVFTIPHSGVDEANESCESVARLLDSKFEWLHAIKHGIRRKSAVPKSATTRNRPTMEDHKTSLEFNVSRYYRFYGGNIMLIDDVKTLGATAEACRAVLQHELQGFSVYGFFLGRTIR